MNYLRFAYSGLSFDASRSPYVRDAFEAALVDGRGRPLVATFAAARDAFFNVTETGQPGHLVEMDTTEKIFSNPANKATEDYVSGRFG